jgi:hypothetical protein
VTNDSSILDLIEHLESVSSLESWTSSSSAGLAALRHPSRELAEYFEAMTDRRRAFTFDGSHDTSTHYKWLVYRSPQSKFVLWLHEYKDPKDRLAGYAQVPHDHRYDISSLILEGGYTSALWQRFDETIRQAGEEVYRKGSIITLTHDQIHSLVRIEPETMTLVVEGPTIKGFSSAYDEGRGKPRIFRDFPTRWPEFRLKLYP